MQSSSQTRNLYNDSVSSDQKNQLIEKSLEYLYGSKDHKLLGMKQILALCQDLDAPAYLIENHQLMSALTRLYGEDDLMIEMSFAISKLFLAFSMVNEYHEILSNFRVGALTLRAVALELRRAHHRRKPPVVVASSDLASPTYSYSFSNKQEILLSVCCNILCHIADDYSALRKMIKKSLVTMLGHCLDIQATDLLTSVLCLLIKASIFEETAVELLRGESLAIEKLVSLLHVSKVNELAVRVLFNLSFNVECAHLISSKSIHSPIIKMLRNKSTYAPACKLAYHLSSNEDNRFFFVTAGISSALMDLLREISPRGRMDEVLSGLLVNLTLHPLCAEEILLHNGERVTNIFRIIKQSNSHCDIQVLLKVIRNLSQWTTELQYRLHKALILGDSRPLEGWVKRAETYWSSTESNQESSDSDKSNFIQNSIIYWEHHFWDAHIEFLLQSALHCENDDLLVEWIRILTNITKDDLPAGLQWHDLLFDNNCKIVRLCRRILDSDKTENLRDDLKLEVTIWLGELCASKECSHWIASSNLIDAMHDKLIQCAALVDGSEEMLLQLLLSYKQFMMYEETRFQVIGGGGVVEAMLSCLTKGHAVKRTAEECLVLIEDFERDQDCVLGSSGMAIKCIRYEALVEQIIY
ncbi:hypothetical protein HJC23_008590 [Cyclotella cryptica]|uniref:Uncharacterized protein n=1 Tax=Cyclotella cryptica TaxID=29204 RepID=A0ABD3Q7Y1_9STRA